MTAVWILTCLLAALLPPALGAAEPPRRAVVLFEDALSLAPLDDPTTTRTSRLNLLHDNARASRTAFLARHGARVEPEGFLWLVNGALVTASPAELERMRRAPGVRSVELDEEVSLVAPRGSDAPAPEGAVTSGLRQLRVPQVWDRGFRGQGQTMGVIDTGIDPTHPDLVGKTAVWHDFVNGQAEPYDDNGHGTHCAGTMAGGNASGTAIGVAPEARLVVAKGISGSGSGWSSTLLQAMQWMADPDGDPATADAPCVVSNSWGGSTKTYYLEAVRRWIQLGIFPAFATGNSGPGPRTVLTPAGFPESFAVAAIDALDAPASFSSRGPFRWDGRMLVKPDGSLPGVDVYSAKAGGGWVSYSGTSMACPHLGGLVALLRQAAPDLPVGSLRHVLEATAHDLGSPGRDNTYGVGRLDAEAALAVLADSRSIRGVLVDAATQAPLAGTVRLPGEEPTTTDPATGRFVLFALPGTEPVIVTAAAFGYAEATLTCAAGTEQITLPLESLPRGDLRGVVRDGQSGAPLTARVRLLDSPLMSVETLADGGFAFDALPVGTFSLLVTSPGFASTTVGPVEVTTGDLDLTVDLAPVPPVLLVDDDGRARYERWYADTLAVLGRTFDTWDVAAAGSPSFEDLVAYETVVWLTGDERRDTLTASDQETLEAYLDAGGRILASGQYLSESLRSSPFLRRALGVRHSPSAPTSRSLRMGGHTFAIEGGDGAANQKGPARLNGLDGATEFISYRPVGGAAAVDASCMGGRSLTLGFGFEAVSMSADRVKLMDALLARLTPSPEQMVGRVGRLASPDLRRCLAESLSRRGDLSDEQRHRLARAVPGRRSPGR